MQNIFNDIIWIIINSSTVRAVSFLDLIVENGYSIAIYFKYSFLNLFGIAPKFEF